MAAAKHILCVLLAVLLAYAPKLMAADPEVVVFDSDSAPAMYAKDGQAAGLYPAIVAEAFRRMGSPVKLETAAWARVLGCLDAGSCGAGGISKNSVRLARYDFSEPIHVEQVLVWVNGQGFPFEGLGDLGGKRLGVVRGYSYGDGFDKAVAAGALRVEYAESDASNFTRLSQGELDAVLAGRENGELVLARFGLESTVRALPRPVLSEGVYVAFNASAGKKELLARFNAALGAMRADGALQRLVLESVQVR